MPPWMPSGVLSGTSNWKDFLEADPQHTVGLYIPSGLEMPLGSPWRGGAGGRSQGVEVSLGYFACADINSPMVLCIAETHVRVKLAQIRSGDEPHSFTQMCLSYKRGDDALYWILSPHGSYSR